MAHVIFRVSVKHLNIAKSSYNMYFLMYKIPKYTRISLKSDIMHGLSFEYIGYTLKRSRQSFPSLTEEGKKGKRKRGGKEIIFHLYFCIS
jgi:hypothetical protein